MGSRAIAISPDGRNVYVASSDERRDRRLPPRPPDRRPHPAQGQRRLRRRQRRRRLRRDSASIGPNSVAVSPDGRNVYATSREGASLTIFRRNPKTGALTQLPPRPGCVSGLAIPGCTAGRALKGPDVVVVSPDGNNVYVGSFFGNAVATFSRNPTSGALDPAGGTAGCIAESAAPKAAPPGSRWARSRDWRSPPTAPRVYAAAALSNAVDVLTRDATTGALSQATDGSGCIVQRRARRLRHRRPAQPAPTRSPPAHGQGGNVYVTSLFSNSVTSFTTPRSGTGLAQIAGPARLPRLPALAPAAPSAGRWSRRRGWPSRPTAPTSTSPPSRPARSTSSTAIRKPARSPRSPAPPAASRRTYGRRLHAAPGARRRQLGRRQPRRAQRLLDRLRHPTPSTSSGGSNEPKPRAPAGA